MPENQPIHINPVDLEPDIALGIDLPIDNSYGSSMSSTFFTKDQIKANMRSVFTTMIGERVMQPEFGTRLYEFLFRPIDEELKHEMISKEVERCINLWVPGVVITGLEFPIDPNENLIRVKISYVIPNYNIEDNLALEVQ